MIRKSGNRFSEKIMRQDYNLVAKAYMSMPAIERVIPLVGQLPASIREALARRLRELAGLALIALSGVAAAALMTWSVQDPSLSHATSRAIRNIVGYPGAIGADLLMQILGLGAIMLILPVAVWGWRMLTHRTFDREALRIACWILCTVIIGGLCQLLAAWRGMAAADRAWRRGRRRAGARARRGVRPARPALSPRARDHPVRRFCRDIPDRRRHGVASAGRGIDRDRGRRRAVRGAGRRRLGLAGMGLSCRHEREGATVAVADFGLWLAGRQRAVAAGLRVRAPGAPSGRPRRGPSLAPQADEDFDDEEDDEEIPAARAPRKKAAPRAPARKSSDKFELPPINVLTAPKASDRQPLSKSELDSNSRALEGVLGDFGVRGEIVKAHPGPVVTLYELEPAPGIKSSRVIGLADDIARSMSALSARVAVVPGRNAIGIELPNPHREKVYLRELLAVKDGNESIAKLPLCLGKNIGGESIIVDLARMPHLLIAGTTGSGKSVAINTMILSLLYRLRPDQCRLIMVDPKMLELSVYDGIPHLLTPVVTDPKKAVVALKWAVREMEERYKKMSKLGVRNIDGYNARLLEAKSKGEELSRTVHTGFDKETGKAVYEEEKLDLDPLPYIVIIVDEMADLMMVAGKDIEGAVQRLAQMARAAGLHVILATQRPSVDVITGTIKANFPTRISFQVTSKIDSRTILGEMGAEQLLGQGDMLYMAGGGRISRVHGPFVSDEEVEKVVRHLKTQGQPEYLEAVTAEEPTDEDGAVFDSTGMGGDGGGDLFSQAVAIVKRDRKASTSYIQRRLQIGYNRAASLMERMELEGIVGQANHAGKREILVEEEEGGF